jgi:methylmalonyl-CoA mutase
MSPTHETGTSRKLATGIVDPQVFPIRVVTAAALFDGHDAAINLIRRLLVRHGVEVIHLGHNRSAAEIASAVIQEDADAAAVSSYQGGHSEFFRYLRKLLDDQGGAHVRVFAGGGGVILPAEIEDLEAGVVDKVFTPEDGRRLGLDGMIDAMLDRVRESRRSTDAPQQTLRWDEPAGVAQALSFLDHGGSIDALTFDRSVTVTPRVLGVTGTGGAGKSSLVDELVLRMRAHLAGTPIAVLAVDPTKRRTGGALLGDRLRMNAVYSGGVFLRSVATGGKDATRGGGVEVAPVVERAVAMLGRAGFGVVIVETAGIGQGSSGILDVADVSLYVMTSDFGGPTQLEKIDMLDFADAIAVNKADRRGSADALREVKKHVTRSRGESDVLVVATSASRFCDGGVDELFDGLVARLVGDGIATLASTADHDRPHERVIPLNREQYLSEIAAAVRAYHVRCDESVDAFRRWDALRRAADLLEPEHGDAAAVTREAADVARDEAKDAIELLREWETIAASYREDELRFEIRGVERSAPLWRESLAGSRVPRIALPTAREPAEILRFLRRENLPGRFPFTAGVFPLKREEELATRQFAGEGPPGRTNRRFHLLTSGLDAQRLSVAFDSVTLYGADPDERPDIYGKIGESGVSIATLDDMKKLFEGFDLCSPSTSVSMTINGPAPVVLAMFFGAAIDGAIEKFRAETGREPDADESEDLRRRTLETTRGTVQADILKEDQAQNTCIFSTPFALRLMGDVQGFFIENGVRNFYSVSVSGYHIAEAGANPITQLAFTLANGLTYVEYFKSRGMAPDDFAPNLSFFFSNGLDPEYAVLGRVARRIWAIVLRDVYGANERSQKLKYHIQTSGRSLHSREMSFNDIRTTLQALMAVYDHCNSLHTNAYDEAVTTPTAESVRRALAIQLIIQREFGLAKNENPLQGSFIIDELTDLVEEAVLREFERIAERGGVLGAMETGYLRSRIQEESLHYEDLKHSGELEIIGVNSFLGEEDTHEKLAAVAAVRATTAEKDGQIRGVREFQKKGAKNSPEALARLKRTVLDGGNVFGELMNTVRHSSLGQITRALFEVGGQYRRSV